MAAKIFDGILEEEFERFYREILFSVNHCNAYTISVCFDCNKFEMKRHKQKFRCDNCREFYKSLTSLYMRSTFAQWDYFSNFLHDFFKLHYLTKEYFYDVHEYVSPNMGDNCFDCYFKRHKDS